MISPPRLASPPGLSAALSTLLAQPACPPSGSLRWLQEPDVPVQCRLPAAEGCCSALRISQNL